LLDQMHGAPVVINVWASWCTPCRQEAPLLSAAAARHPDVQFLGVDVQDSREGAVSFIDEQRIQYPSLFDPAGAITTDLGALGPPITVFYTPDGAVAMKVPGLLSRAALDQGLAKISA
jgi:cytochrome c biogenesis protein CcmG, thiol:disulfide interchange protein DsbE